MGIAIRAAAAAVTLMVATPALADKTFAVTPSGASEMLFPEKPQAVIGKLSSRCIDNKWTVTSSTSNEVVCEAPLNFGQSVMGQLLMGNSYSTPPRRFFKFNVAEVGGISRVQATGWMELQMAFGQMKRQEFSGPEFQNGAFSFLGSAGGKYPVGTTFPNHVQLGFDSDDVRMGKYFGLRIKKLEPGMPAERAGLQVDDVVTKITGKAFKNMGDYLDATAKAAATPTYEVEVFRNSKAVKMTVDRAFRPAWAEQVVAVAEPTPTGAPVAQAGIADELAKLAKLKADGVLTDSEFEAQKKKLLGQ